MYLITYLLGDANTCIISTLSSEIIVVGDKNPSQVCDI